MGSGAVKPDLHPIVADMNPSRQQLPAITARGCDVVVTAGAGTGKTLTLVARYLSLLADELPLRSILAITFTNKAAREMRNRVRDEVRKHLQTKLSPTERARFQELYTQLDAARIGTIHSFCADLLRAHPAEAEVDPRFEVLEEGQITILRTRAVEEALGWAADDVQAVRLFALLGERHLRFALDTLLGKRWDVDETVQRCQGDLLTRWREALAERKERELSQLLDAPAWKEAASTLELASATDPNDALEGERRRALAALHGAEQGSLRDRIAALSQLDEISVSRGSTRAWRGGAKQLAVVKQALKTLREQWKDRSDLLQLELNSADDDWAEGAPLLHRAYSVACERYDAFKQQLGALDFDDLEHRGLVLLRDRESVRRRWQGELQAILVDEFQDTNGRQRDLVNLLNGPQDKLFIVGDAKQSIYRFRGADVTVFRQERRRIERCGGKAFTLDTSYRAHEGLVAALNDLLKCVLPPSEDPYRPWAEPFAKLVPYRPNAAEGLAAPHIELLLAVGTKKEGALVRAGQAVAFRITEWMEKGIHFSGEDHPRAMEYSDVAILCRASTSFGAYEDALDAFGIPYLTAAGRGFYDRPEIRDVLNALQALADPTDDLALVGVLRSPAFALSDLALYDLCQERDRRAPGSSLWEGLWEAIGNLSPEQRPAASRAVESIADLHNRVGRMPVADVLKAFLDATHYRAALFLAGQARAARNVSKLLADAHASRLVGVGAFLEYVNHLRDTGVREGEARGTAEGAVQIMSVHAAKGLEFPVVVIGDITHASQRRPSILVDPQLGIVTRLEDQNAQPSAYRLAKNRCQDQENAEDDRLFYVAATRAREKLILSGCIRLKRDGTLGSVRGWLGKIAGPDALGLGTQRLNSEGQDDTLDVPLQIDDTSVACRIYHADVARKPVGSSDEAETSLVALRLPPPLLAPIAATAQHLDRRIAGEDRLPMQRVWRVVPSARKPSAPAWVIGSIVHEALASWRFPTAGGPMDAEDFARWAQARARGYGITDAGQTANAVGQCRRLLGRFRSHPLFGEMDSADRRFHEVPYTLKRDNQVESGIIDALFLRDGSWSIVEFKTDRVKDETELELLLQREGHREQAQRYVAAVERLLQKRPRFILCMLNYVGGIHLLPGYEHTEPRGAKAVPQG
jgi:ATP-dependent helicase/nuclease subunit A